MKQLGKLFLILCICLSFIACSRVTQNNFEKVKPGMTTQEVVAILGEPTSSDSINIGGISGTSAVWKGENAEITVQFLNDKVQIKSYSKLTGKEKEAETGNDTNEG